MTTDDMELVRDYARSNTEEAFAALVARHVSLVYSVALRQVRDPHLAEEITQAVFVILAQKAARLGPKTILAGWLCRTARYVSANALTIQWRRQRREQEAYMQSLAHESESETWNQIAPLLDAALAKLGEKDHDAVVLRFFENKDLKQIGAALGTSESGAGKRLNRALEKLRKFFTKRGVFSTTAVIAGAMAANSIQAAPVTLAKSVTMVAVTKGAAASSSTLTLIKGALKLMAWTKAKMAIAAGVAIILAAGTTTVVVDKVTALSATDLSWADNPKYWELNVGSPDPQEGLKTSQARWAAFNEKMEKLPPALILRPTRFRKDLFSMSSGDIYLGRGQPLAELMKFAYDPSGSYGRSILPDDFPRGRFDLMLTLQDKPREALQNEIRKKFGFVAHTEMIETNVLALRVKNTNAAALQVSKGGMPSYPTRMSRGGISIKNQQLGGVAACFEALLKTRVVDRTEIKGFYDIILKWEVAPGETEAEAFKRAVLEQLGFEFVPDRQAFKYFIVEKTE